MTTDIDKLAQQMREAAGKASPGPWRVVTDYPALAIGAGDYRVVQTPNQNNLRRFGPANNWDGIPSEANAAYIALANPTAVLALLDDRERLAASLIEGEREKAAARGLQIGTAEVLAAKERECEELRAALREARDALNGAPNTVGLHAQIDAALATSGGGNG